MTLGNPQVTVGKLVGKLMGILLVSTIYQLSEILTDLGVHILSLRYLCKYSWVTVKSSRCTAKITTLT
jgi:uncharacterized membrane protein (Fun14 family)